MDDARAEHRKRAFSVGLALGAALAMAALDLKPEAATASASFALHHGGTVARRSTEDRSGPASPCASVPPCLPARKPPESPRPRVAVALAPSMPATPSFAWPVEGPVSSCYGERWGRIHVGVDVAAPEGVKVLAALDGRVVYSGSLPGYGNLLLLEHAGGWYTVYAHNQRHLVEATGDGRALVHAGQPIAIVGRTGNATGPHVHFEIRKGIDAIDPLPVLPQRVYALR